MTEERETYFSIRPQNSSIVDRTLKLRNDQNAHEGCLFLSISFLAVWFLIFQCTILAFGHTGLHPHGNVIRTGYSLPSLAPQKSGTREDKK
ncbi:MAG: hypothetical protein A3I44_06060 [Candidatus Sungbacteria bacterium RIFCSPLOWO2_02_FULL_51_17]|uniref:Uncharacterized protein n=1 Tax=Candidatus Sungbacteria bacterium RIFCSPHIGHO2_02_FULL_51_29 TaxID=1802273 RepID=A0A1G2KWQ1_9BACT|nr:MAG: hypothetical protein A2676_03245 [Candidatus Sungbacteria bacterium RIFCSPHIGHO2_01_FULL_51_22]OHA03614.1 MAG: hypothetical protein A3C16_03090 [Candidatus Sungbacteria bacterium RIFCSPHIGHO2_02_FULL_51_29]OHA06617.1 MAG: hypothetical protein A3B29_04505 [Candidatus Sungbacteria bacterium RIFCSPLOWO2_01_FULL_51_34]OHA12414.1 MAG: hypothetical protein A3I44_06060 [Candidatus Sungbacteria bacterium RIFCSPLOWO2_02_FULL_51_17]